MTPIRREKQTKRSWKERKPWWAARLGLDGLAVNWTWCSVWLRRSVTPAVAPLRRAFKSFATFTGWTFSWRVPLQGEPRAAHPPQLAQAGRIDAGVPGSVWYKFISSRLFAVCIAARCARWRGWTERFATSCRFCEEKFVWLSGACGEKAINVSPDSRPHSFVSFGCDKYRWAFRRSPWGTNAGWRYVCTSTHSKRRK